MTEQNQPNNNIPEEGKLPAAPTGNASNPSPTEDVGLPQENAQLLDARAEKYLRESASIEDLPDEQDWQDADKTLRDE